MSEEKERVFPDDYWQIDKEGAFQAITGLGDNIKKGYLLGQGISLKPFKSIFVAGMGGSGIAGDLLKELLEQDEEFLHSIITGKTYTLPKAFNKDSLFIGVSYSGNTEETLSMYKHASRKGAQCILISSGGKLEELAKINKHQHLMLPSKMQPRMAIAYLFFSVLKIIENNAETKGYAKDVEELSQVLKRNDIFKKAIELSEKCYEKTPLIYADQSFFSVAYRWKTQFNENAKTTAFCHAFSELNHNEVLAFKNKVGDYHCFLLSTDNQHRRITKRIGLTREILQKENIAVTEISIKGSFLKQMFTTIYLGDLISFFLALRYETDPTPVTIIEEFKKNLGPFLI